jgi:hypothetical protein
MTTGLLDLEVEDYGSRTPRDARPAEREDGSTVSVPALLVLTAVLAVFVTVAVLLSQAAGAC